LYISQYYTNSLTGLKQVRYVCAFGLCLVIMGEVIRKASMITASTNFNHYVQYRKQQDHQLVTHGIYAWSRHPSYVGWFLWSVGTQVIRWRGLDTFRHYQLIWWYNEQRYVW